MIEGKSSDTDLTEWCKLNAGSLDGCRLMGGMVVIKSIRGMCE